jgi:hypothetical protein
MRLLFSTLKKELRRKSSKLCLQLKRRLTSLQEPAKIKRKVLTLPRIMEKTITKKRKLPRLEMKERMKLKAKKVIVVEVAVKINRYFY